MELPLLIDAAIYPATKDGKYFPMLYVIHYSEEERTVSLIPKLPFTEKALQRDLIRKKEYILPCKVRLAPLQN